ncbi:MULTISPECIES: hypothetical protein [Brevibacillus]|jgi:hypothetical protein|uniref:hypothetical protein n=1 Tax=Brevibacillus TaxID=55080 RepID=UPI001B8EB79E|nr:MULTISPECIES: hypothetical protein [Bacillales]MBR8659807.1 hypothetical protein [Brevibacillus sp. NL20B1]UFJ62085.1 hypothetical protein IRT44_04465 [Anoxybacillus sediminis]
MADWLLYSYFFFICLTIVLAIVCLIRKKNTFFSALTLVLAITAPLVFFLHALARGAGTELEHFVRELRAGELWAIFVLCAFAEIVWWYGKTLWEFRGKR